MLFNQFTVYCLREIMFMIEFKQINDMFCIAKNIKMNKEIK